MKRFGYDHHGGGWAQGGIKTDIAGSSGNRNSQIGVLLSIADVVARHRFVEEIQPSVIGNWDRQTDPVRRPAEPSKMLVLHEDPAQEHILLRTGQLDDEFFWKAPSGE